jgi:hypothetical protein
MDRACLQVDGGHFMSNQIPLIGLMNKLELLTYERARPHADLMRPERWGEIGSGCQGSQLIHHHHQQQ